jgi:serine/threonine-protein kinase RsbW
MEEINIDVPLSIDSLYLLTSLSRNVCDLLAKKRGVNSISDDVELAVSEACTNAIKYAGTSSAEERLRVSLQIYEEKLIVKVQEQGKGFDLNSTPEPDFTKQNDSGYGICIIKAKMDDVSYSREGTWNSFSMTKLLKKKK